MADKIRPVQPASSPQDPPDGGSSDSPTVVLHWAGDEGIWGDLPNRDITTADPYSPEQLDAAVSAGTHTRS